MRVGRAVYGALAMLSACTAPPLPPASPTTAVNLSPADELAAAYERSIRAAAVRDPGFKVELRTISSEQSRVTVANFTEWGPPASPTKKLTWVSLPEQLRDLCRGKPDAVLAVQQALGLPPQAAPSRPDHHWQVITFTVPRSALFRPCPGGTDIAKPYCANPLADTLDTATAFFLLGQLWTSARVGFHTTDGAPDWGYPFSGMGWTYNWDPAAASHIGTTEFMVRKDTVLLSSLVATTPAQFCNAAVRP